MNRFLKPSFAFLAVLAAFFPFRASAVTVTDISDQVSSSQISVGSNHKFILTAADDVAIGENIQITFPTGFVLSALTEDDIDITDDGTDLSTAADCSGLESASASTSGQTITITVCSDYGGAILSASIINIEIGTNASFSGLGTQRITNPSAVISWFVNLSGTSGNSGSVVLATTTSGSSSVSATAPTPASSSGGGGGSGSSSYVPPSAPPEDTTIETPVDDTLPPEDTVIPPEDVVIPSEDPENPSEDTVTESGSGETTTTISGSPSYSGGGGGGTSSGASTTATSTSSAETSGIVIENIDVPQTEGSSTLPDIVFPTDELSTIPIAQTPTKSTTTTKAIAKVEESVAVVQSAISNIVAVIEEIRAMPEVKQAVNIAIPVASVAVATTTVVLVSSFNLLSYLQFLFTSPLLLLARRKRKAFGIVYNSITKVAIDLATVRLYDAVTNRLVRSAVTDATGKYFFIANPGQYRLAVTKNTWAFPSAYLGGVKDDGVYLDVYSGQTIVVTEKDATIAANIPLDHVNNEIEQSKQGMLNRRLLRKLQFVFSISGIFLSAAIYFLSPSTLTMSLAIVQALVFLLCLRLAKAKRARGWGIVFDSTSRRPVGNAVVRLFEPKYNKLVESTLTDTLGRYSFLVGPNEYFVRTDKPGYDEHVVRPIDYRQKTEPSAIAIDVPLTPAKPV